MNAMNAHECPCNSLQPFRTLWKIILRKVWGVYVCEELEASRITGFSKANSASSQIWLKTKLRIDYEILIIDPESLERESRCIDGSIFSPTPNLLFIAIY